MNSLKVGSWYVHNSIFIILEGFINSSKGKILSNDKFVLICVEVFGVRWCRPVLRNDGGFGLAFCWVFFKPWGMYTPLSL